jgi:vacuolar-type H+-ATPase subunit B/Vma2
MVGMQSAIGEGMTRRDHSEVSNQVFTSGLLHEFCRG